MKLKAIFWFVMFLFLVSGLKSQSVDFTKISSKYLSKLSKEAERTSNYFIAKAYLQELHSRKPEDVEIKYRYAISLMQTRDYQQAAKLFEEIATIEVLEIPEVWFYLGEMQKALGKYEESIASFEFYKKISRRSKSNIENKVYKAALSGSEMALQNPTDTLNMEIFSLPYGINGPHIEYSPIIVDANHLIYAASREESEKYLPADSAEQLKIYQHRSFYKAVFVEGEWEFAGKFIGPKESANHALGGGCFSSNGNAFYFTLCEMNYKNKRECKIYKSQKLSNNEWQKPELLPTPINMKGYTSSQPHVVFDAGSKSDMLYFVSDRPYGKGGLDIWYTEFDVKNEQFKAPKNCGSKINTAQNEITPHYHPKTKTLYYSSNGLTGFGGYDIFKNVGERNKWPASSRNIGGNFNTGVDELYFTISENEEFGFFTSNSTSANSLFNPTCCDDLYGFKAINFYEVINDLHFEFPEDKCPDSLGLLKVFIEIEGELLEISTQELEDCHETLILRPGFTYVYEIHYPGFFTIREEFSSIDTDEPHQYETTIKMDKIDEKPILLGKILFDFDSYELTDSAKFDLSRGLLKILENNELLVVEIACHTDNKGTAAYNLDLSKKRSKSVIDYLIANGIPKKRMQSVGYGDSRPIAPNNFPDGSDNPEGRKLNRRMEYQVIGILEAPVEIKSKSKRKRGEIED